MARRSCHFINGNDWMKQFHNIYHSSRVALTIANVWSSICGTVQPDFLKISTECSLDFTEEIGRGVTLNTPSTPHCTSAIKWTEWVRNLLISWKFLFIGGWWSAQMSSGVRYEHQGCHQRGNFHKTWKNQFFFNQRGKNVDFGDFYGKTVEIWNRSQGKNMDFPIFANFCQFL